MGKQQQPKKKLTEAEALRMFGGASPQKKNINGPSISGDGSQSPKSSGSGSAPAIVSSGTPGDFSMSGLPQQAPAPVGAPAPLNPNRIPTPVPEAPQAEVADISTNYTPFGEPTELRDFTREETLRRDIAAMPWYDRMAFKTNQFAGAFNRAILSETIPSVLNTADAFLQKQAYLSGFEPGEMDIPLDKWAKSYKDTADEWLGTTFFNDPALSNELYTQVGAGLGQAFTVPITRGIPVAPIAMQFDSSYQTAKEDLISQGVPEQDAENRAFDHAMRVTAVSAPLEVLPYANLFARIDKYTGGTVKNNIFQAFRNGAQNFLEEGTTETLQQLYSNMDYKMAVNSTKDITEGLVDSFLVGGITGGSFGTVISMATARRDAATTPDERAAWDEAINVAQKNEKEFTQKMESAGNVKDGIIANTAIESQNNMIEEKDGDWTKEDVQAIDDFDKSIEEQSPKSYEIIKRQTAGQTNKINSLLAEKSNLYRSASTDAEIDAANKREAEINSEISDLIKIRQQTKARIIKSQVIDPSMQKIDIPKPKTVHDKGNEQGVPSEVGVGQESQQAQPVNQGGQEEASPNRIFQEQEVTPGITKEQLPSMGISVEDDVATGEIKEAPITIDKISPPPPEELAAAEARIAETGAENIDMSMPIKAVMAPDGSIQIIEGLDQYVVAQQTGAPVKIDMAVNNAPADVVAGVLSPGPAPVKEGIIPPELASTEPGEVTMRRTAERIMNDKSLTQPIKDALSDDSKFYQKTSIAINQEQARSIIAINGLDSVVDDLINKKHQDTMSPSVFIALQTEALEQMNEDINEKVASGDKRGLSQMLSRYDSLFNSFAQRGTTIAQSLNQYKIFAKAHPLYYVWQTEKSIQKERNAVKDKNKDLIKETTEKLSAVDEEIANDIAKKIKSKVEKKPKVKAPKEASFKKEEILAKKQQAKDAFNKALREQRGQANAGIDPKVIAAATKYGYYLIADGYYDFKEWSAKMVEDLGESIKDSLDDIWKVKYEDSQLSAIAARLKEHEVRTKTSKIITGSLEEKISDIVKKHFSQQEKAKEDLVNKIMDGLELSETDANEIASLIEEEFDSMVKTKRQQILTKAFEKGKVVKIKKTPKQLHDKIIEMSNLGALDEDAVGELYADYFGLPKLTPEQRLEIQRLTEEVNKAKGSRAINKATQDLLRYQENIKSVDWMDVGISIWYANILSGPKTHVTNNSANALQLGGEAIVSTLVKPQNFRHIMNGLIEGSKVGWVDAAHVLDTGYDPYKTSKIDTPNTLERVSFAGGALNPYNYYKYVRRFMTASDILAFNAAKYMRLHELAANQARKEKKQNPSLNIKLRVNEILNNTKGKRILAKETAISEGYKEGSRDFKRRYYEAMEEQIAESFISDATDFGLDTTFSQDPVSVLGYLTDQIAGIGEKVQYKGFKPIKYVVPFTRAIANVANKYIDWTPYGAVRSVKGSTGTFAPEKYKREYTKDERHKLMAKAILGTLAMTIAYMASDPEDEEGFLITADGAGDINKNYQLAQQGWKAYSMSFDGGKTWISYQNTPLYIPFAFIGYLRDQEKYNGKNLDKMDESDEITMAALRTGRFITDMTFLSSVAGLLDGYSNQAKMEANLKRIAASTVRGHVIPNFYSQIYRDISQLYDIPQKQANELHQQLYRDIPGINAGLYPMIDQLGDPIPPDADRFISTPHSMDEDTEKVWDMIIANQAFIGRVSKKQLESELYAAGYTKEISDEEYYNYMAYRGKMIKASLIEALPDFADMSKDDIQDEVQDIVKSSTKEAKWDKFISKDPNYVE